jgi:hypothetical protein
VVVLLPTRQCAVNPLAATIGAATLTADRTRRHSDGLSHGTVGRIMPQALAAGGQDLGVLRTGELGEARFVRRRSIRRSVARGFDHLDGRRAGGRTRLSTHSQLSA